LPNASVTPIGETHFPSPQRTLLLLYRSYGLIRQSQRALLYFGFASLKESSQVVYQSLLPAGPCRVAPGNFTPRRSQIPDVNLSIHPARATE
jgi:hypothetical protein